MKYLLAGLLIIATVLYLPNSGGMGITLPYNLLFIAWLGLVLIIWEQRKAFINHQPRYQPLLLVGGVALLIPWLLQAYGNPGVWVLLAALSLWCLLANISLTRRHKRFILQTIFVLALAQSGMGLIQSFLPHLAFRLFEYDWLRVHGRSVGIFQQVNLFGSFLATGMSCGFLLLLTTRNRRVSCAYLAGLGMAAFVLSLNQSRAGQIGLIVTLLLISGLMWRKSAGRILLSFSVMALTSLAGWYLIHHLHVMVNGEPYLLGRDYAGSNHERWYILCVTWKMIMEKPWLGWGYGTFEYAFSRWVLAHPETGWRYGNVIGYPHNELLFAWFQGGVVALSGMLLLFAGWLKLLLRAWRSDRLSAGYALLILPLLAHLELEYPFYQSFIHFGLFIVLLRLSVQDVPATSRGASESKRVLSMLSALSGAALVAFSVCGLYANAQLTELERNNLLDYPNPMPWYFAAQGERASFDSMVALLIDYNQTRNEQDLDEFVARAERWSLRYNDQKVWQSRIMIAGHRKEVMQQQALLRQYALLFPAQKTKT